MVDTRGSGSHLENDIFALGDGREVNLDLGEGEHIGRGGQVGDKVRDDRLGASSRKGAHGTDGKVGGTFAGGL